jgi:hypothetical protein
VQRKVLITPWRRSAVAIVVVAATSFAVGVLCAASGLIAHEGVSALADVLTGAGTLIVAYATVKGVAAWREQLKGRDEYELAKRILLSCYRVERVIR